MRHMILALVLAASAAAFGDGLDDFISGRGPTNVTTSVETIRASAFANVRGVVTLKADQAVQVGLGCFNGCVALEELSLNSMADSRNFKGMLSGCRSLKAVYLDRMEYVPGGMNGFPWGLPLEANALFYFGNGVYDRAGRRVR